MPVQMFPPEILDLFLDELASAKDRQSRAALLACTLVNSVFYHQATSYIFSSLWISTRTSEKRLNTLLAILNANSDIARHIRSFTVELKDWSSERVSAVLRQLFHLRKFGCICALFPKNENEAQAIINMITSCIGNFSSLTALHFQKWRHFPLSVFSLCNQLESLTLSDVGFAKIEPKTLSGSLFSSLKRLKISGPIQSDESMEAVRTIMTRAAPTLTTLLISDIAIYYKMLTDSRFFLNLNSTVFPVLKSIHWMSSWLTYPDAEDTMDLPTLISQFIDYSAPMVNQIQMEILWLYEKPNGPSTFELANEWLPIDKILSSPKYPALKTFDLTLLERYPAVSSESDVRTFLNGIFPAVSSCSQTRINIGADSFHREFQFIAIRFAF